MATTDEVVLQEQQAIVEEPVTEAGTPSVRRSARDRKASPKKKAAMESSLATNVIDKKVDPVEEASTPSMVASPTVRRSTRDKKSSPKKMATMESNSASTTVDNKKTGPIEEGTLDKKSPAKATKRTYATAECWDEVNEKSTLQESETKPEDSSKKIAVQRDEDVSEESNKGETASASQEPVVPKETIAQASPLDTVAIDAAVEACNNINVADITSPAPTNEAAGVDTTTTSQQREDLSILTVVQLKDRLRGLNLAVSGRKQELIDRLNGHLYGNGKHYVVCCI